MDNTAFTITFGDEVTGPIPFPPSSSTGDWSCQQGTREVQTLTTNTVDINAARRDATVSLKLEFALTCEDETIDKTTANLSNGDCSMAACDIRSDLTALGAVSTIRVTNKKLRNTEGCERSPPSCPPAALLTSLTRPGTTMAP